MSSREESIWCVRDTLSGAVYPQPNKLIAEKVAEMHGHCEVFEKAHAPTDDEREALYLIEQAASFREQTSPDVDAFPNSMVGLWLRTASALESALRRSEVPEPRGYRAILIQEARAHADHYRRYDDTEDLVGTLVGMANMLAADATEPQGEPSDAQVEHMRRALNAADIDYSAREQRADAGGGDMEPGDWFTFLARTALRAAGGVR